MRDVLVYHPHRNFFRLMFMLSMLVKGVTYGFFGFRITADHSHVMEWEQVCGFFLIAATLAIIVGLFWYGDDVGIGVLLRRWGYFTFGIAEAIFAFGSFVYGFSEGFTMFLVNVLFATAGFQAMWEENRVVKWRMGHVK